MNDPYTHLSLARSLATLLDSQWNVLGIRFGLDPVFDLIPGVGTIIPTALSLYIVWIGYTSGLPPTLLFRMIVNVVLDGLVGSLPIIGLIADTVFKANNSNMRIIDGYLQNHPIIVT